MFCPPPIVLVIDSLEVSKKHSSLPSFTFSNSDPLLTHQRSKLENDNEHEDENDWDAEGCAMG
jgi:hypothetical protein